MIVALALAVASPQSAVDAERAFAAMAQTDGMWTAFRATAAPEASMFVPRRVRAHDFLKDRKDPLLGYMWWPAEAYVSCDGSVAVTTGPSVLGRTRGYFTTIWARLPDGSWKWIFDHGDALERPRKAGERARVRIASCKRKDAGRGGGISELLLDDGDGSGGIGGDANRQVGQGRSMDGTLTWRWEVAPDASRTLTVALSNGETPVEVLRDEVKAPAP